MRMRDVLLDTDQGKTLNDIKNLYIFRVRQNYLFITILDSLYDCNFSMLFEAASFLSQSGRG